MKVYIIDKEGKKKDLQQALQTELKQEIEIKPDWSFRTIKTDYVIVIEDTPHVEELQKNSHLILVTKTIDSRLIYQLSCQKNICDMIDIECDTCFLAKRIKEVIQK